MKDGEPLRLKFEARLKIFQHEKAFLLAIYPESSDVLQKLQDLEEKLNELACSRKLEIQKVHPAFAKFQQGDFHLLKKDKSDYRKIYGKLYVNR